MKNTSKFQILNITRLYHSEEEYKNSKDAMLVQLGRCKKCQKWHQKSIMHKNVFYLTLNSDEYSDFSRALCFRFVHQSTSFY